MVNRWKRPRNSPSLTAVTPAKAPVARITKPNVKENRLAPRQMASFLNAKPRRKAMATVRGETTAASAICMMPAVVPGSPRVS